MVGPRNKTSACVYVMSTIGEERRGGRVSIYNIPCGQ